jgi:hypothetical protein
MEALKISCTVTGFSVKMAPPDSRRFPEGSASWAPFTVTQYLPTRFWPDRTMLSFKPHSITQLTITGFLAITVLLLAALFITARQLDKLSVRNQQIINQSFTALSASRTLTEQTLAMERNMRQFTITENEEFLQFFKARRNTFSEVLNRLDGINLTPVLDHKLANIRQYEETLYFDYGETGLNEAVAGLFPVLLEDQNGTPILIPV